MKQIGKISGKGLALFLIVAAFWWPVSATAVEDADVAVLLTEVVEAGVDDGDQQIAFWWSQADEPQWTVSDDVVFAALRNAGVEPVVPESVDISRIYRRPGLSTENAAQLGRLLDADRVLVGEVQYTVLGPVAPLGYTGVEARAVVELVPAGDSEGVSLERFTVTRKVFGDSAAELLDEARQVAGTALGEVMGQSMRRAGGEVGSRNGDSLLALRNVERAENLEKVRERLLSIDDVERVVERWASEGLIALDIKTTGGDSGVVEYAFRVLENHEFEGFDLMLNERPTVDGVTEFWLTPRQTGF